MKTLLLLFVFPLLVRAEDSIPDAQAFTGWHDTGYTTSNLDLNTLTKVAVNCPADPTRLYPTHPQQETKFYHRYNWGTYDQSLLTGSSSACAQPSPNKDPKAKFSCLRSDEVYDVIMSDIYRDRCGHLYRGFWHFNFLKADENMGTLFSRGRTVYQNPKSDFPGDVYVGQTYWVGVSDFTFLTPALPGDAELAIKAKSRALSTTHVFDETTLLFNNK